MAIQAGTYKLGSDNATLRVKTGRHGRAAKMGHNLVIEVRDWQATLDVADDAAASSLELTVDATSLHVVEGVGGLQKLEDDDKADIRKTIDKEVLKQQAIAFTSTSVSPTDDGLAISGDLTMGGETKPLDFAITAADGALAGEAAIKQSDWGIEPYSALFGSLKVKDEVHIEFEGTLPS